MPTYDELVGGQTLEHYCAGVLLALPWVFCFFVLGKLFKNPRAKPDGTKMFCSAFLNDARMCCFFANAIVKY